MRLLIYNFFLSLYPFGIRFAAIWNNKARLWIAGRKNFPFIDNKSIKSIWMHCASLGEFEQGLPVLEKIKAEHPEHRIVITFFSPSGYEIKKNYKGADHIFYLPTDSVDHAKRFIKLINPKIVLWIKYEYWFYYLSELKNKNIPVLLISSTFRKDQPFFKWYGSFWKEMLTCFNHFFVQNENSKLLLQSIGYNNVSLSGDTRFDRVITIAENFDEVDLMKEFCGTSKVIVAGSTWEDDEAEWVHYINSNLSIKFIIAPHEIDKENLNDVKKKFKGSIFYSEWISNLKSETPYVKKETYSHVSHLPSPVNCLIIDNIGMLSRLYNYADVTYVGGGFGDEGLHNILEAAVYGKPVIFGPEYEKNTEAEELLDCGGAFCIENAIDLEKALTKLFFNDEKLKHMGIAAKNYVYKNAGATKKIMEYIYENRLLTN